VALAAKKASMSSSIKKLREISDCCRAGAPLSPALGAWLGRALQDYLCRRVSKLDEAFGLRFGRGGVPWWRVLAIRERDIALRSLASAFFPDAPVHRQATLIHQLSTRYAAANWILDRASETMPTRYVATPNEFVWRAFISGAPMPLCRRRLQSILAQSRRSYPSRRPTPLSDQMIRVQGPCPPVSRGLPV
jgi:hypothetical protein